LARLSASLAYLTLSTEDFTIVTVTEEHVDEIVKFVEDEYENVGLDQLAEKNLEKKMTSENLESAIVDLLVQVNRNNTDARPRLDADKVKGILKFIALQGKVTKAQVLDRFGLPEKNVGRPLFSWLLNIELVRSAHGFVPSPTLVRLYKEGFLPCLPPLPTKKEPPFLSYALN
jgi:hypothetical protein